MLDKGINLYTNNPLLIMNLQSYQDFFFKINFNNINLPLDGSGARFTVMLRDSSGEYLLDTIYFGGTDQLQIAFPRIFHHDSPNAIFGWYHNDFRDISDNDSFDSTDASLNFSYRFTKISDTINGWNFFIDAGGHLGSWYSITVDILPNNSISEYSIPLENITFNNASN